MPIATDTAADAAPEASAAALARTPGFRVAGLADAAAVMAFVAAHPPFRSYAAGVLVPALLEQLEQGANVLALGPDGPVAYAGWRQVRAPEARDWRAGGPLPLSDWENGDAAIVNITVAASPALLRPLLRGVSHACAGRPVYRLRAFQDGRPDMRRPPIHGRMPSPAHAPADNRPARGACGPQDAVAPVLDALVQSLYRRAVVPAASRTHDDDRLHPGWPLRLVESPEVLRAVLAAPEGFDKNLDFLTDFAWARLSCPGGQGWRARVALTQAWYRRQSAVEPPAVRLAYRAALQAALPADGEGLFEAFVDAGAAVFSSALGMAEPLPWPRPLRAELRQALRDRQVLGWTAAAPAAMEAAQQRLHQLRQRIAEHWQAHEPARRQLAMLSEHAQALAAGRAEAGPADRQADAVQELALALMAATETTASALQWACELLARNPALLRACGDARTADCVAREALRLFPPVPLLTRISRKDQTVAGMHFARGEPIGLSIVALHLDAAHWADPLEFRPQRWRDAAVPRSAWLPFSRGERVCAGMAIGHTEMVAALQELADLAELRPATREPVMRWGLSLRPASDLHAMRHAAASTRA